MNTTLLIDWASVPKGTQTNFGELLAYKDNNCEIYYGWCLFPNRYGIEPTSELRLAYAGHQPWLPYIDGLTEIPEWAEVTYRGYKRGMGGLYELSYAAGLDCLHSYKLGNTKGKLFKDGWTDNPDEVTE